MSNQTGPTNCLCGVELPMHLVELSAGGITHVCSCEVSWEWNGQEFIENGKQINPFARYDLEQGSLYTDKEKRLH